MKRYLVETEFRPGERTEILATDNYERAAEKANFWDERQNTWLVDMERLLPVEWAVRMLDDVERKMNLALDRL